MSTLEQVAGALLGLTVLLDIFLIVLYARTHSGIFSKYLSHGLWRAFVWISRRAGRWKDSLLTISGPLILLAVLMSWALLLSLAAAPKVQLLSAETGDAAEVIARLGPRGTFESGYQILAQWAGDAAEVKESHGFHDMLFYFRFRQAFYSVSRTVLTALDTVALIKSALDDNEYRWLKESAAVEELGRAAFMWLMTVADFSPRGTQGAGAPDETRREEWRGRYEGAVERLHRAGIKTNKSGAEQYVSLRAEWDGIIQDLAPQYAYDMDEIDPAVARVKQG